jgi:two-component system sensor histidine kinase VicK
MNTEWQKLASGTMTLQFEDFDFRQWITSTVYNQRCLLRFNLLSTSVSIDPEIPLRVSADKFKITQILLNYMSNAIKFTTKGSRIKVSCYCKNGEVVVAVEEEGGPGVAKKDEIMLFQRFVQLPRSQQRHEAGTGLGMHFIEFAYLIKV